MFPDFPAFYFDLYDTTQILHTKNEVAILVEQQMSELCRSMKPCT